MKPQYLNNFCCLGFYSFIYINNKNFFVQNLEKIKNKYKVKPLRTFINIGEALVDEKELSEISEISYPDMKSKFNLTIYRIRAGKMAWRERQNYILFIAKRKPETCNRVLCNAHTNAQSCNHAAACRTSCKSDSWWSDTVTAHAHAGRVS